LRKNSHVSVKTSLLEREAAGLGYRKPLYVLG
jgi:hypothetical protein